MSAVKNNWQQAAGSSITFTDHQISINIRNDWKMTKYSSPLIGVPIGLLMFRLAVPGTIGAIIFSCLGIVEATFLKRISTEALAAVAIVFPLIMLAAMFSAGAIGGAVSGHIARALGAGNQNQASSILICTLIISLAGGGLMYFAVIAWGPWLYNHSTDNPIVASAAQNYAAMVFPAIPAFWLLNMLCSVLRGTGDMVRPAIVALVMVASYTVFASFLLSDIDGSLDDSMQNAALSLILSYITSLIVTLYFILRSKQPIRADFKTFRVSTLWSILRQGLFASSQSFMTICYAMVTTILFSRFGTDWLAGFGLAVRLELLMVPVIFGIGASLIAIVGAYVGAGLRKEAISIAWKGVLINAVIVGGVGILFAIFPGIWCESLGSDLVVSSNCNQALRVIAPTYLFFALGLGCYFASQGLNTLGFPVLGAFTRLAVVATGLFWVTESTPPDLVLTLVAGAVVLYGVVVISGLKLGPWKAG